MKYIGLTLIFILCISTVTYSVEPDEILRDSVLEERARAISKELRCLVCRNENIDSSNSALARDLRLLVRDRLKLGDSDKDIITFVVDRYGEYVLLMPQKTGPGLLLWVLVPMIFVMAGSIAIGFIKINSAKSKEADKEPELSLIEKRKVDNIIKNILK